MSFCYSMALKKLNNSIVKRTETVGQPFIEDNT